jgi:hyperosmotically inducible periplasmic protein
MHDHRRLLYAALLTPVLLLPAAPALRASEPDHRLVEAIKSSYNFKTYLPADSITVTATEGVVTLKGMVPEEHQKILAAETAEGIAGVKKVDNQITVEEPSSGNLADGLITMKVKGALAFHSNVSALRTKVETKDGEVTLTGEADTPAQSELTTEYARDVEGVKGVKNLIVITGTKEERPLADRIDDASVTAQVKTSLFFHRSTHILATKVKTRNGVVTLKGEVQNPAEKALVGKLVEDIPGVKRVDNQLIAKKS